MAQQSNLFPPDPSSAPPKPLSEAQLRALRRRPSPRSPWLERTELLVRVIVRLYLGLLLIALPWMRFWTENSLFSYVPGAELLANSGFVRGMVSGLGLLNVAFAVLAMLAPKSEQ